MKVLVEFDCDDDMDKWTLEEVKTVVEEAFEGVACSAKVLWAEGK